MGPRLFRTEIRPRNLHVDRWLSLTILTPDVSKGFADNDVTEHNVTKDKNANNKRIPIFPNCHSMNRYCDEAPDQRGI